MADMYRLSVATTASDPSFSLMVVKPARSPKRMVAVRCWPRMESEFGSAASRSTSCGLTRARNCRVMRAFSRWFTTAAVETLAACEAMAQSTGTATGNIRSCMANAHAPAPRIHAAASSNVTAVLGPAPNFHAKNAHSTPNTAPTAHPDQGGISETPCHSSTMSAASAWK